MDEWIAVSEAARLLGISAQRIRQLADSGRLVARRSLYGREIERASLDRLLQERQDSA